MKVDLSDPQFSDSTPAFPIWIQIFFALRGRPIRIDWEFEMALLTRSVAEIAEMPGVRACVDWFRRERAWINEQHLKLCRVPAPTFFEQKRAEWMAERFRSLGWEAKMDRAGNVIAHAGSRDAAQVAVTAHLDTVLAPRSAEEIKLAGDGRLLGPGVSDNGAGLAALLALAAAWNAHPPAEERAARCWSRMSARRARAI